MKHLLTILFLLALVAATAQKKAPPTAPNPWHELFPSLPETVPADLAIGSELLVYALAGVTGYEAGNVRPAGPDVRLGFLLNHFGLVVNGGGGYNSYAIDGRYHRFYNFEGGLGASVHDRLFITANLAYYGKRNGSDGAFGLVVRPLVKIYSPADRLHIIGSAGLAFTDDFMSWSGALGVTYKL